jgi:hypothetical protein
VYQSAFYNKGITNCLKNSNLKENNCLDEHSCAAFKARPHYSCSCVRSLLQPELTKWTSKLVCIQSLRISSQQISAPDPDFPAAVSFWCTSMSNVDGLLDSRRAIHGACATCRYHCCNPAIRCQDNTLQQDTTVFSHNLFISYMLVCHSTWCNADSWDRMVK